MIRPFAILQVSAFAVLAAGPPLHEFASPFPAKDCEVKWEAPTNLPTSIKNFTVVPTQFAPATISNLLQLADLTPRNKRRPIGGGVFLEKDVQAYGNKEDTRQLTVLPSQGLLALSRDGVLAALPRQKPEGVPSDQQAVTLALALAQKLGLNPSELPRSADGKPLPFDVSEATVLQKEKTTGQMITNIVSRTVCIHRWIEGIPVSGMAGIAMKFGNEGKLASLNWTWRAVKPAGECAVPDAAGFVSRIKSGRTFISQDQAGQPVRRLTIKRVQLYYWENEGSKAQTMIRPFAVLEAETNLPGKDSQTRLFVPLGSE